MRRKASLQRSDIVAGRRVEALAVGAERIVEGAEVLLRGALEGADTRPRDGVEQLAVLGEALLHRRDIFPRRRLELPPM